MGTRVALGAGIALALALTRYHACACSGPSDEPADEDAPANAPADQEDVARATDSHAEAPDGRAFEPAVQVQYVVRTYGEEPERRFGVRAPGRPEIAADCIEGDCVLDGAWWHGPGDYVFWVDDLESGERHATVSLAGDELEVSLSSSELEVVHRIQNVELQVAPGDEHALTLVNRTDRAFETTFNDGAALYALVHGGPSSWTGARVTPHLDCGRGISQKVVDAGSTTPLGLLEQNVFWFYESPDAETVVVMLEDPGDMRIERLLAANGIVVSHVWAVTTQLPPELIEWRQQSEQRLSAHRAQLHVR